MELKPTDLILRRREAPSRRMAAGSVSLVAVLRDARKSALLRTRLNIGHALAPKGTILLLLSCPMSARPNHGILDLRHQYRAISSSFIPKSGSFGVMLLQRPSM